MEGGSSLVTFIFADDEEIIRKGMRQCIDWEAEGIEWLGTASNGRETLKMIQELSPDIVMVDIKMPQLSGLDVIREAQELPDKPEFIIYSGFDEFEFAKTAIRYGVREYLLKPLREEELIHCLRRIIAEIDAKKSAVPEEKPVDEEPTVTKIKQYLKQHYMDEHLTLKMLCAKELYMSPKYVSRIFHKETGTYFKQYLLEMRVEEAKKLMQNGERKIKDIARRVGLDDNPQYFSQIFKKSTGFTPSDYIQSIHENHRE